MKINLAIIIGVLPHPTFICEYRNTFNIIIIIIIIIITQGYHMLVINVYLASQNMFLQSNVAIIKVFKKTLI
jgi:hypothetical protein